jgi:sec-independent protein translocase protein TatA
MPFKVGWPELILVLVIVLLVFGVGRLGRLGKDLGEGINAFRKGLKSDQEEEGAEEDESGDSHELT